MRSIYFLIITYVPNINKIETRVQGKFLFSCFLIAPFKLEKWGTGRDGKKGVIIE